MKKIKLPNINQSEFIKAFESFKKFVNSDIEYNNYLNEIHTASKEFDKWQLMTLASFYGGNLFRATNELRLIEHQLCDVVFEKAYHSQSVELKTEWNDEIEIKPILMFDADSFLTKKLVNSISNNSKKQLIEKMPTLNTEQSVYRVTKEAMKFEHFAYIIIKSTLIFIRDEKEKATITNLWKIEWNEI